MYGSNPYMFEQSAMFAYYTTVNLLNTPSLINPAETRILSTVPMFAKNGVPSNMLVPKVAGLTSCKGVPLENSAPVAPSGQASSNRKERAAPDRRTCRWYAAPASQRPDRCPWRRLMVCAAMLRASPTVRSRASPSRSQRGRPWRE